MYGGICMFMCVCECAYCEAIIANATIAVPANPFSPFFSLFNQFSQSSLLFVVDIS